VPFVPAPFNRAARRKLMRFLRRRRGVAAVVVALLLVPAAVASDAAGGWSTAADEQPLTPTANGLGRGFFGIELDDLGASGQLPEVDQLSDELLRLAGDPNALASGDGFSSPSGPLNIPSTAMQAYKKAEALLAVQLPNCHISWALLASIGRIESGHGNGGQVDTKGYTLNRILGPVLNGAGFAAVPDTDGGVLDGDNQWDRAVGPMQFIPATWQQYAADGNGDGVKSPHNFFDAATAAGKYLCSGGLDLSNAQQRGIAVFRYNHSESYVRTVLIWADAYAAGTTTIPDGLGSTTYPDVQAGQAPYNPPIEITPAPTTQPSTSSTPPPPTSTEITIPGTSKPTKTIPSSSSPPPSSSHPSDPPSSSNPPSSSCTSTSTTTTTSAPPASGSSGSADTSTTTRSSAPAAAADGDADQEPCG
jgi:hypothetical protein